MSSIGFSNILITPDFLYKIFPPETLDSNWGSSNLGAAFGASCVETLL